MTTEDQKLTNGSVKSTVSIALMLHKLCNASLILLVSAFTMQKCHLQNREPVSFSLIHYCL